MMEINNNSLYIQNQFGTTNIVSDINLEDISVMYTTEKKEEDRSNFFETFKEVPLENSQTGQKFLNGLISNKNELMKDLGFESEEYDRYACIALALASQETGMGAEDGYEFENKGFGKFLRWVAKQFDSSSASSGVTQMKIFDFLNTSGKLSEEQKNLMAKYGIEAWNKTGNNLYENPDKAAVATMIVLSSIADNYDNYINTLSNEHSNIENNFNKAGITPEDVQNKGQDILTNLIDIYNNIREDSTKANLRETFKQVLLSQNGSTKKQRGVDKDYNEEIQLNNLNKILNSQREDFSIEASDLDYIRYLLTGSGQEMTNSEYCAYAWNKGTGTTGMQLDRLLADKIGTILATPENFDYDQFTVNVNTLANMYAYQSFDASNAPILGYTLGDLLV